MVKISISIPSDLLENIEKNIEGKNRNEKILKCLELGLYALQTKGERP